MSRVWTKSHTSKTKNEVKEYEKENIIDSQLEYVDPTPNLQSLFMQFNRRFFWGKLDMVEVKWSPRMTTCAGICTYRGRQKGCVIALSAPLLSLRPRKDMVETLLHEMIHAYLFVTHNNKDRDGHGPEFHKHMYRINQEAGTSISVYHSFHDEVRHCQPHVWRCNGFCQSHKPFYGLVRRSMNRAPGPNDFWWKQHEATCGGKFIKIAEPEPKNKKTGQHKVQSSSSSSSNTNNTTNSIAKYFTPVDTSTPVSSPTEVNKVFTLKDVPTSSNSYQPTVRPPKRTSTEPQVGLHTTQHKITKTDPRAQARVREIWAQKTFVKPSIACPVCANKFPEAEISSHVDRCLGNKAEEVGEDYQVLKERGKCPICSRSFPVKDINTHVNNCLSDKDQVVLVKDQVRCPVCEKTMLVAQVKDHLEDCLRCSFENEDIEQDEESGALADGGASDMAVCPCCVKEVPSQAINQHIDECLTTVALQNGLFDA